MLRDPTTALVDDLLVWQEQSVQSSQTPPTAGATCRECLLALLEGRRTYGNQGDPTRWRAGDVRSLMLDVAVTRLTGVCDLPAHGGDAVTSLLHHLAATDGFHPASASAKTLLAEAGDVAPRFPAAFTDRSRWRLAKTWPRRRGLRWPCRSPSAPSWLD